MNIQNSPFTLCKFPLFGDKWICLKKIKSMCEKEVFNDGSCS
jgi:hypothetical protein